MVVQTRSMKRCKKPWLPPGVVSEILSRLPVRSLLRFRSVSKTWRSIIHHPKFIKSYKTRPNSQIHFVRSKPGNIQFTVRCTKTFRLKAKPGSPKQILVEPCCKYQPTFTVIGSVDGLFLLQIGTMLQWLLLWNPSISSCRLLPKTPPEVKGQITNVGIGLDLSTEDYKHVRIAYGNKEKLVLIYTVGTNSWKTIPFKTKGRCGPYFHRSNDNRQRVCFRGTLYLIVQMTDEFNQKQQLLSFDLRSEEFSSADLPIVEDDGSQRVTNWFLKCASDGSRLALVGIRSYKWSIWWAQGEGGNVTWSKKITISRLATDVLNIDFKIMSTSSDKTSMELLLRSKDRVNLYTVQVHKGNIILEKKRSAPSGINSRFDFACATPYIESLELLN